MSHSTDVGAKIRRKSLSKQQNNLSIRTEEHHCASGMSGIANVNKTKTNTNTMRDY